METAIKEKTDLIIAPESARAPRSHVATVSADASSLMKIIDRAAMDPTFDVAKLEQLLAVKERWEKSEAEKAYVAAMARFKSDVPVILKSKEVDIPGGAKFSHATLAAVCDAVIPSLSRYGFSHKWEISQADRQITVTCVLTHELGHKERTTLSGAPDDSGKKNAIQQVASTVTYLERYTLLAATGLSAKDNDDDGNGGAKGKRMDEKVLADHLSAIDAAADEPSLKKAYGAAWNAANTLGDAHAIKKLTEHKDRRKEAIKPGGRK